MELERKSFTYAVFMEKLNEYAFVRARNMVNSEGFGYLFIDILDFKSPNLIQDHNLIKNANPLTSSFTMLDRIRLKGKYEWKFVFEDSFRDYEEYFPEFRDCIDQNIFSKTYNEKTGYWLHIIDNNARFQKKEDYEKIKHLGYNWGSNVKYSNMFIAMVWMVRLGLSVPDFYPDADYKTEFLTTQMRIHAEHLIFYDKIPKEKWNRL